MTSIPPVAVPVRRAVVHVVQAETWAHTHYLAVRTRRWWLARAVVWLYARCFPRHIICWSVTEES